MNSQIEIQAAEGISPGWYFPAQQQTDAGVIMLMDVFGLRPSLIEVAERIATLGYNVLLPDLYYRLGTYEPISSVAAVTDDADKFADVRKRRDLTPLDLTDADIPFFVEELTQRGATGRVGIVGYCMGGGRALRAGAKAPDRIAAVASIHGGNLATEAADSPHLRLSGSARVYVASASQDNSFSAEQSGRLASTLYAMGIDHLLESYVGCKHGWVIRDNRSYDEAGAERNWKRLEAFLAESLR